MYKISENSGGDYYLDNTESCTAAYLLQVWCQKTGFRAKNGKNPVGKVLKRGDPGPPDELYWIDCGYRNMIYPF